MCLNISLNSIYSQTVHLSAKAYDSFYTLLDLSIRVRVKDIAPNKVGREELHRANVKFKDSFPSEARLKSGALGLMYVVEWSCVLSESCNLAVKLKVYKYGPTGDFRLFLVKLDKLPPRKLHYV